MIADEVMVMYLGRPVEEGPAEALFREPRHPYTRALFSATPVADPGRRRARIRLEGEPPSPLAPPPGCPFHPRCPLVVDRCRQSYPEIARFGAQRSACWRAAEVPEQLGRPAIAG